MGNIYNSKFRVQFQSMDGGNEEIYARTIAEVRSFFAKHLHVLDDSTRDYLVDMPSGETLECWFPNYYKKLIVTRL